MLKQSHDARMEVQKNQNTIPPPPLPQHRVCLRLVRPSPHTIPVQTVCRITWTSLEFLSPPPPQLAFPPTHALCTRDIHKPSSFAKIDAAPNTP
mmetsp:Transcript_39610/g.58331  ORF Transcript_39610/g.58331 Transcript_39610/m.58331 type:complete len:94 (-) Transcript_39610:380-661(-)